MKKIIILCLVLMVLVIPVSATKDLAADLVVDYGGLLTASEEAELDAQLQDVCREYDMYVVILTTDSLEGKTPRRYADDFYDYNGYGDDGVLLLVSTEDNDWYISTCGYGITAFTDAGIDYIGEQLKDDLHDGEYMDAFEEFVRQCDDFLRQAATGEPYDNGNMPKEDFALITNLIFALVVGLVVSLIVVFCLKRQLKSVKRQSTAANYVRPGSLQLTNSGEIFLYHTVSRTEKPKQNNGSGVHRSASGRMHGGRDGKF